MVPLSFSKFFVKKNLATFFASYTCESVFHVQCQYVIGIIKQLFIKIACIYLVMASNYSWKQILTYT